MYDFKVTLSRLELLRGFWNETREIPDGSVQLIRYRDYERSDALKLEKGWAPYGGKERYYIDFEQPRARELEISVSIIRSSQNIYRAVYADSKKTEIPTFTSLSELNSYISKIAQRPIPSLPAAAPKKTAAGR